MTPAQRRKFWALLGDIARQVSWPVNDSMGYLDKTDWRLIICAGFTKETRTARGVEGGYVVLGLRLRDIFKDMDEQVAKEYASELIEFTMEFGTRYCVKWSDPELIQEAA